MNSITAFVVIAVAPAWGAGARAQEAAPEPSKLFTQDAVPVGEGVLQVQTHFSCLRSLKRWDADGERESRDRRRDMAVEGALNYGVTGDLDVGFGGGYFWLVDGEGDPDSGRGVGDMTLSSKYRFFEDEGLGSAVALVPSLLVPVGEEGDDERLGPGAADWALDVRMAVTREWPGSWTLTADLGYLAALGGKDDFHGVWFMDVAVGYQPLSWMQPEIELNGVLHLHRGMPDSHRISVSGGFVLPLADWVTVRVGLQQGILGENIDETTVARLSVDWYF